MLVGLLTHFDLQRIDGGLSAYTALVCEQFLTTPCKAGFTLPGLNGRGCKIHLSWFTADFDAIRTTFLSRGSAGLRPCLNCANVVKKDAQLNDHLFVEIAAATLDKCVPVKDHDFLNQCDRLQDLVNAGSTKKEIENLAFRLGLPTTKMDCYGTKMCVCFCHLPRLSLILCILTWPMALQVKKLCLCGGKLQLWGWKEVLFLRFCMFWNFIEIRLIIVR